MRHQNGLLPAFSGVASTGAQLDRARLESDLRARSSVARFGLTVEVPAAVQLSFAAAGIPERSHGTPREPGECDHAGTGRENQGRLLGFGFELVCSCCGGCV